MYNDVIIKIILKTNFVSCMLLHLSFSCIVYQIIRNCVCALIKIDKNDNSHIYMKLSTSHKVMQTWHEEYHIELEQKVDRSKNGKRSSCSE